MLHPPALGNIQKGDYGSDDSTILDNRVNPIFDRKGHPVGAPKNFAVAMDSLPFSEWGVNGALLTEVGVIFQRGVMDQMVDFLAQQLLFPGKTEQLDAGTIAKSAIPLDVQAIDGFSR
jgi:hypothetical protein